MQTPQRYPPQTSQMRQYPQPGYSPVSKYVIILVSLSKLGTSINMFFSLISCILALFRKAPFGPVPENTSCDFYVGIMCKSVNSSNSGILDR